MTIAKHHNESHSPLIPTCFSIQRTPGAEWCLWAPAMLTYLLTSGQPEREETEEQQLPPVEESSQAPVETGHGCLPPASPPFLFLFLSLSHTQAFLFSSLSYPNNRCCRRTVGVARANPQPPHASPSHKLQAPPASKPLSRHSDPAPSQRGGQGVILESGYIQSPERWDGTTCLLPAYSPQPASSAQGV